MNPIESHRPTNRVKDAFRAVTAVALAVSGSAALHSPVRGEEKGPDPIPERVTFEPVSPLPFEVDVVPFPQHAETNVTIQTIQGAKPETDDTSSQAEATQRIAESMAESIGRTMNEIFALLREAEQKKVESAIDDQKRNDGKDPSNTKGSDINHE